jgi:glucosamine--fructose-6-phosphate aminotransferase (isomerizing)
MEQEINEEAAVVRKMLKRFVKNQQVVIPELKDAKSALNKVKRILILGSGSSRHAGLVGEYWLEELAGINVENEFSNEYRFKAIEPEEKTLVIAISQSGETKDTLEAVQKLKHENILTLALTNKADSTLAKLSDIAIIMDAGEEKAIAATKTFISEIIMLALLALSLSKKKTKGAALKQLKLLPEKINKILLQKNKIKKIAVKLKSYQDFILLGRKFDYPIALEGALKFKETALAHAEGFPLGEFMHGPLALVGKNTPVIILFPFTTTFQNDLSALLKIKSKGAKIILLTDRAAKDLQKFSPSIINLPHGDEMIFSILAAVVLQLLAFDLTLIKKLNPDKAKGLSKAIVVD